MVCVLKKFNILLYFMDIFNKDKIKQLKGKINKLKEEKEKIKTRMKKERKRAKEAVTEKQKAQRKNNILSQKMETLKDRLEKSKNNTKTKRRDKTVDLDLESIEKLEKIAQKTKNNKKTVYHIPDLFDIEVNFPIDNVNKKRGYIAVFSSTGAVFTAKGVDILKKEIIKSDVRSKHSAGGFSQARFERGIEKQIKRHISKIKNNMGIVKDLDCIVTGDEILSKEFNCTFRSCNVSKIRNEKDLKRILYSVWNLKGKIKQ